MGAARDDISTAIAPLFRRGWGRLFFAARGDLNPYETRGLWTSDSATEHLLFTIGSQPLR